jgi:hypothetical protein
MTIQNLTPNGIDISQPNVARIYDYPLGGKDNFAADRDAAKRLIQAIPDVAAIARDNRSGLGSPGSPNGGPSRGPRRPGGSIPCAEA